MNVNDVDDDDNDVVIPNATTTGVPLLPSALQQYDKVAAMMMTVASRIATL